MIVICLNKNILQYITMLCIKFLILVIVVLFAYTVGYYAVDVYDLSSKHGLFKFTAFECRPCFTFHVSWVTSTAISLLFGDFVMLFIGILFALMTYLGLKKDVENKTIKIDDYDNDKYDIGGHKAD